MPSVRSGMSIGILLMLILSSLLMVLSSSKADAQTATCQMELDTLREAFGDADFTNEKDRTNLLAKVDAAESKLRAGKPDDAKQKILDIQQAVNRLAADGKLTDASGINAAIDAALACIEGTSSA